MNILTAKDICKYYGNHTALDHLNLEIPTGKVFGLLGPNGAGKTSFIRIINQITAPDKGEVLFNGEPLNPNHISRIGYLPEERGLYKKMKVGEQALYLAQLKGMAKADAKTKLLDWFERFGMHDWWDKKVESLSKGMAQKVQFITTVLHEPELLILDEPFSGFDPINANLIKDEILRLKNQGTTIILSTHNMGSVEEICDNIALINSSKKVLEGGVKEIRKHFSKKTFEIEFSGELIGFTNALWTGFELVGKPNKDEERIIATIRILEGNNINSLLGAILGTVTVYGIREVVPSMNEIFIEVVKANQNKTEEVQTN
jgi:ABC-2 type transport system ATP-binding protein